MTLGVMLASLEAAVSSLSDARLKAWVDRGGALAGWAQRVLNERVSLGAKLLAGRVLCLAMAVACATYGTRDRGSLVVSAVVAAGVAGAYGILAEVGMAIARRRADLWVLRVLWVSRPFALLAVPFTAPLAWIGGMVERFVPRRHPADDAERVTELGFEYLIEEGTEGGSITPDHARLLRSVLEFKDTLAHEVMVPRTRVVAMELTTPMEEVLRLVVEKGHSRYPVYKGRLDQVVGVLYAKDLIHRLQQGIPLTEISVDGVMRVPVFFTAESQKIVKLLREMQSRRVHLAVVVDEFGGTSGIVTLEDILEEIVGEIQDEYDMEEQQIYEIGPHRYLVNASVSIHDLEDRLGASLGYHEGRDYDSLGGFVVELAGRMPAVGESVMASSYEVIVRDADQTKIRRVELKRVTDGSNASSSEPVVAAG